MTPPSPGKTAAIVIVSLGMIAGGLTIFYEPTIVTGGFYELTIESVEVDPEGEAHIVYRDRLAYATDVLWELPAPSKRSRQTLHDKWGRRDEGFLRWPRRDTDRLDQWLTSEEERARGMKDSPELRKRLLLKPGTYRIPVNDTLIFYRRTDPDGEGVEGTITVTEIP